MGLGKSVAFRLVARVSIESENMFSFALSVQHNVSLDKPEDTEPGAHSSKPCSKKRFRSKQGTTASASIPAKDLFETMSLTLATAVILGAKIHKARPRDLRRPSGFPALSCALGSQEAPHTRHTDAHYGLLKNCQGLQVFLCDACIHACTV